MRRVFCTTAFLFGIGLTVAFAQRAAAQAVDIPLNYALNTGHNYGSQISDPVLILTINVGVNGGAARPYAFDTGSAVFLTPSGVFTGGTSSVVNIDTYGGVSTFSGNVYQVTASSLKYYAAPGATSGGISLGTSGNYNTASYTLLNGNVPISQPFGTAAVGVFGADPTAFTVSGTQVGMGGVFGQTVLPNTTAGLCGLGERSESRCAEFATGYKHSRRSGHQRAAVCPNRSAVCDELQSLRNGRPYARASRAILTSEHSQFHRERTSISEFQCAGLQQIRAVQFHFELPARQFHALEPADRVCGFGFHRLSSGHQPDDLPEQLPSSCADDRRS
jgi:hypothetical protein